MKTSSVNLSSVTTYRFGGLCKNFITVDNVDSFSKISEKINSSNTFVLGKGSNIAFADSEYSGYVLQTDFGFINLLNEGNTLEEIYIEVDKCQILCLCCHHIVTDIDQVYLHYGTENQSPIDQMTDIEAKKTFLMCCEKIGIVPAIEACYVINAALKEIKKRKN